MSNFEKLKSKFDSRCKGTVYQPTPTAPPLETSQIVSHRQITLHRPASPPPPPPYSFDGEYADPDFQNASRNRRGSLRRRATSFLSERIIWRKNWTIFWMALAEFSISAFLLGAGILCAARALEFCPFVSAIWLSAFFMANALVGMASAKLDSQNLCVAHLVLSLVSIVLGIVGTVLAAINWLLIGTSDRSKPDHPIVGKDRNRLYCILSENDPSRFTYIQRHIRDPELAQCLLKLKLGIAVLTIQMLFSTILVILFIVSAILCARRIYSSK